MSPTVCLKVEEPNKERLRQTTTARYMGYYVMDFIFYFQVQRNPIQAYEGLQ